VLIAGNQLPDMFLEAAQASTIQNEPEFLESQCADLTPYLSGDNIKAFPNLANLPPYMWQTMVFNGKIFGVPVPSGWYTATVFTHQEYLDPTNAAQPKTTDEFLKLCQQLNKPDQNRWAIAMEQGVAYGVGESFIPAMFKAPNGWRLEASGRLTRSYETPEFKAAVGYAVSLVKANVMDMENNNVAAKDAFQSRKAAMRWDGWGAYGQYWDAALKYNPPGTIRTLRPFSNDGSQPTYFLGSGSFGFTAIRKASADRVKELLGILNYLASPFGSQEWALIQYGVKDVDYTLDQNGNPVLTDKGKSDLNIPWGFIARPADVLYNSVNSQEYGSVFHAAEEAIVAATAYSPTLGLYSAAEGSTGRTITNAFNSGVTDIVLGRRPLSDLDQLISDWRSKGGDKIRTEFEQAITKAS